VGGIHGDVFANQAAHLAHEQAKIDLTNLVPEDSQQASDHGLRAKRSKSGAIYFDLPAAEIDHAL
jgi:hypothetical protein